MKPAIFTSSLLFRFVLALASLVSAGLVRPQRAAAAIFYSTTSQFQASATSLCVVTCSAGVQNGSLAADASLDNYALLRTSMVSAVSLRLGLSGTGQKGDRAGVVVANGTGLLNINVIGAVRIRTYLQAGTSLQLQESRLIDADVVKSALLEKDRPVQLEFIANEPFNQVEVEIGALSLGYTMKVFYAYAVPTNVQPNVAGYISRFGSTGSNQYSTAGTGSSGVCLNTDVDNPGNAVDNDLSNFASFSSVLTVACPSALTVKLEGTSPAGYYAGFMIGSDGLLDASVLSGLRMHTWLNGVEQETATGASLLQLQVLPNGQTQVSFPTNLPFDQVTIERVGLLSALDNLRLYYGFGVAPQAFNGTTNVLSNFGTPTTSQYNVQASALLCVGCAVDNPQNAADNSTDPNSYAQMNMPVTLGGELSLLLHLNGTGHAGNRAGMVIGNGAGLLDLGVLNSMTVSTYDAAGHILESRTGSSLLSLRVLPDGRQEVYFNTTRDFSSVQLTLATGVAALASTRVYYAFADDHTSDFPLSVTPPTPLPVQLTSFTARWVNGRAELSWATASEKNSSHFVVERATGAGDAPFKAIGVVAAAGSSNTVQKYVLRDAEAAAQKVPTLYYRLRQVDKDDSETFSTVVALSVGKVAALQLQVYPNPASGSEAVTLNCVGLTSGGQVEVYSEMGQLVRQQSITTTTAQLATTNLASGIYHVVLRDGNGLRLASERLVVTGR